MIEEQDKAILREMIRETCQDVVPDICDTRYVKTADCDKRTSLIEEKADMANSAITKITITQKYELAILSAIAVPVIMACAKFLLGL